MVSISDNFREILDFEPYLEFMVRNARVVGEFFNLGASLAYLPSPNVLSNVHFAFGHFCVSQISFENENAPTREAFSLCLAVKESNVNIK